MRPRWLGEKVSIESGVIAGLIFLLMVSYLAAFTLPADSAALKAWWWVHTLALLAFLPIIPGTKHLHLVLSPLTVFLKRDGFSDIPKLDESETEEDFGLLAGKDLTQIDCAAGVQLRGVRAVHGALSGGEYGEGAEPEGDCAGCARISEGVRAGERQAAAE